uniref:pseudouridine synthase n=1 Tax=Ndongobacter massiliensis TaxID=1871025 RepID=UPI000930C9F3|nr:RluA family pseudouridine synthase [Ndongobacter massiliensis]
MRTVSIGKNDANQRLDRFLAKYLPRASKSLLQKWIREKRIKRNRQKAQAQDVLLVGDELQFYLYEEVLKPLEEVPSSGKSAVKLSYLFENESFCIIDKPKALLSHAASKKDYGHNVVDAFTADLMARGIYVPRNEPSFRPALVNRLDYQTEGLLIAAKTHDALVSLNQKMRSHSIAKYYRALCVGAVHEAFSIAAPLERKEAVTRVGPDGKEAQTHVTPLVTDGRYSLVELELTTGRFHQIRVHLAHVGHPLVGDARYGGPTFPAQGITSQMLIAHRLCFEPIPGVLNGPLDIVSRRLDAFMERAGMFTGQYQKRGEGSRV